jgi:menaquinone-dependent protoporphyrinogen oxidase
MTEVTDVLVIHAGKMGSTRQIAETIADELRAGGLSVDVCAATNALEPSGYRSVVLGSAIYLRRWRPDAIRYLRRNLATLRDLSVWLFQSGPIDPGTITPVPRTVRRIGARLGTQPPMTFGGRLDAQHARGLLARWMASSADMRGDSRDWDAIRAWARGIRDDLADTPKHAEGGRYTGPAIVIAAEPGGSRHRAPTPEEPTDPHTLSNLW